MPEILIKDALNKAFIKVRPERAAIEKFKANFIALLDGIAHNPAETEEFLKNLVSDFLKKTWYAPEYFINTHKRVDLAIHNGDDKSAVGVIIEAKKPDNKIEMIGKENLNAKALQELLLYYFRETIDNNNHDLKHLIITNTLEWFLFDAAEFYRLFSKNKKLVQQYNDFKNGSSLAKDTNYFYTAIASPYIDEVKNEIAYTWFNIREYENIIRDQDKSAENRLIRLYKLLSPNHLLKQSFVNDSNALNQNFYFELLYIIGLTEEKEDGKKVIVRNQTEKRQPASLIESVIFYLSDDVTNEEALFGVALELTITWINRILFLKLLEAQQLRYQGGNSDYAFLNSKTINNFGEMNILFFKVLAVEPKNRDEKVREKYQYTPYLNSSLFEKTETESRYIVISNLQNNEMDIFPSTVLKDATGNKRKGKINILEYIFEFLEAYDFSSEGSEEIQEQNKTLINASVLGLIFEKINGYKDGSYFTPGFITSFICKETIKSVVINKFNEAKRWNAETLQDIYNKLNTDDIASANGIINSISICDPAVGSGHFLVSALNEIIAVKSELGILVDREGRRIKDYFIKVINDELVIEDEDGNFFEYNYKNKEKQRVQETLFQEKRRIIESCLFGVDVNPNSVKICRLRLWIELLKNAYYTKESGYTELETLPNIDINIASGNSLISRFDLNTDLKNTTYTTNDYLNARNNYRNSKNRENNKKLLALIKDIKNDYFEHIKKSNKIFTERENLKKRLGELGEKDGEMDFVTEKELEEKENKIQKLKADLLKKEMELSDFLNGAAYEDAFEWRFEFPEVLDCDGAFIGFDAIIGNPPYISAPAMVENNPVLRRAIIDSGHFSTLYQKWDIFIPFMERGFELLAPNGVFSMIVPYPLTNQMYGKKMRELIVNQYNLIEIVDLNGAKVFDKATVSNCIPFIIKNKNNNSGCLISHINKQMQITRIFRQPFSALVQDKDTAVWNLTTEKREANRHSAMNILGDFCYLSTGMELQASEKTNKGAFTKNDLISEMYDEIHCRKYIEAKDIEKYRIKKIRYLEYNTKRCPDAVRGKRFRELFTRPKIVINCLGYLLAFFDKSVQFVHNHSLNSAVLWKDLEDVDNKSIRANVTRYSRFSRKEMEALSKQIDLRFLLGILNSRYASVLLSNLRGGDYHIYPEHLRNLPVPLVSKAEQQSLIALVDKILAAKAADPQADTSALEREIDRLVYRLYDLTEEEVKVVEEGK